MNKGTKLKDYSKYSNLPQVDLCIYYYPNKNSNRYCAGDYVSVYTEKLVLKFIWKYKVA